MRILALLLFALPAMAGEADLSWDNPPLNTDGSPYTDPGGLIIQYWQGEISEQIDITDPTVDSYKVTDLSGGEWSFVVVAYSDSGIESDPSNVDTKTFIAVYNIVKASRVVMLAYVGTVDAGTECDRSYSVNGRYGVDPDAVDWAPGVSVRPIVVVADCE